MGKTALNASSSRSHMVVRVVVCNTMARESVLNLVDLAGPENVRKRESVISAEARRRQVKEAGNILELLTALSQVIEAN